MTPAEGEGPVPINRFIMGINYALYNLARLTLSRHFEWQPKKPNRTLLHSLWNCKFERRKVSSPSGSSQEGAGSRAADYEGCRRLPTSLRDVSEKQNEIFPVNRSHLCSSLTLENI